MEKRMSLAQFDIGGYANSQKYPHDRQLIKVSSIKNWLRDKVHMIWGTMLSTEITTVIL